MFNSNKIKTPLGLSGERIVKWLNCLKNYIFKILTNNI